MKNPHDVLGVPRGASPDQVREAYRRLARRLHPDRTGGDRQAEEQLKEVNLAYAALVRSPAPREPDLEDLFGEGFFGADFFSVFSGLGRRPPAHEVDVELSFLDAMVGARREFNMDRSSPCQGCTPRTRSSCRQCGGSGRTVQADSVAFGIPAGVDTGARVSARTRLGFTMVARVRVEASAHWQRQGLDLLLRVPVPVPCLKADAVIPVASPYVSGQIKIPPGLVMDKPLRLPGQGVRHHSGRTGDLFITLAPEIACADGSFPSSQAYDKWIQSHAPVAA